MSRQVAQTFQVVQTWAHKARRAGQGEALLELLHLFRKIKPLDVLDLLVVATSNTFTKFDKFTSTSYY